MFLYDRFAVGIHRKLFIKKKVISKFGDYAPHYHMVVKWTFWWKKKQKLEAIA